MKNDHWLKSDKHEFFRASVATNVWRCSKNGDFILTVHAQNRHPSVNTFGKGATYGQAFIDLMGKLGAV